MKAAMKEAFSVLMKKPVRLWGLSLLNCVLSSAAWVLFGVIPGAAIAVGLLLSTSMTMIFLRGLRGEEVCSLQLFDCFRDWHTVKRVLLGMGWMLLWVFLWSLIPVAGIVFGTVRLYEYRLTPYILMTEPEVGITEAIRVSKERTRGWKGKMFLSELIVWAGAAILGALMLIPFVGSIFALFFLLAMALMPLYLGLLRAVYFERITHPREELPEESTVICPVCGEKVKEEASFCPRCGRQLRF